MTGLSALFASRKAVLSLLAMVCVTVLASLGRVSGELALGAITALAGVYSAAQAWEDGHASKAARAKALLEAAKKSGAAVALIASLSVIAGCGAGQSPPGCGEGDLARINAAEHGELAQQCVGFGPDCPGRDAIHAKYKQQREDWFKRCDPGAS